MRYRPVLAPVAALVVALLLALVPALAGCDSDVGEPTAGRTPAAGSPTDAAAEGCPDGFLEAIAAWGDVGFDGVVTLRRGDDTCTAVAGLRDPEAGEPMTPDTVFAIGSVSKPVTAAAVLGLVEEGRVDLDDTAATYVRGLRGPAATVTIAQLLTHTSGLHGDAGPDHRPLSRSAAVAALSRLPLTFPPGTDFGYTNGGYTLLALVIDAVTGDYRSYVADTLLRAGGGFWDGEPAAAGPRAVGYTEEGRSDVMGRFGGPHWATSGNGDLAMTVPELAGWTTGLFRGQLLPRRSTAAVRRPRWDHGDGTSETFGWVRFGKSVLGAVGFGSAGGGGDTGHNAIVAYLPASDLTIAAASSTPELDAERLVQALVPALVAGERVPLPAGGELTSPDPATVEGLAGTYALDDGSTLTVEAVDEGLSVSAAGDAAVDALFALPTGATAADVAAHEAGVVDLLTGDGAAGKGERDALGETVGGVGEVVLRGTVAEGGELHTYVTVLGADLTLEGWYALDEQGGVAAAQVPADPPSLGFEHQRGETLVSIDPTGRRSQVLLSLEGDRLTVDNGAGVVTARRSG